LIYRIIYMNLCIEIMDCSKLLFNLNILSYVLKASSWWIEVFGGELFPIPIYSNHYYV
jgi:hypothetical protein